MVTPWDHWVALLGKGGGEGQRRGTLRRHGPLDGLHPRGFNGAQLLPEGNGLRHEVAI